MTPLRRTLLFSARVHVRLRVNCGSAVREHTQVYRGVKIQEYGGGSDNPERGRADVNLRDEVARDACGRAASVMLGPVETATLRRLDERTRKAEAREWRGGETHRWYPDCKNLRSRRDSGRDLAEDRAKYPSTKHN
jgi:hypothetical protein